MNVKKKKYGVNVKRDCNTNHKINIGNYKSIGLLKAFMLSNNYSASGAHKIYMQKFCQKYDT